MTIPSKVSRRIVVDGVTYRWLVRSRPTYAQANGWTPLTFVVEADQAQGAPLVVDLPPAHPGNWLDLPADPVTPATVADAIRHGVHAGWQPSRAGPPVRLHVPQPQATTPDSTPTDG